MTSGSALNLNIHFHMLFLDGKLSVESRPGTTDVRKFPRTPRMRSRGKGDRFILTYTQWRAERKTERLA